MRYYIKAGAVELKIEIENGSDGDDNDDNPTVLRLSRTTVIMRLGL